MITAEEVMRRIVEGKNLKQKCIPIPPTSTTTSYDSDNLLTDNLCSICMCDYACYYTSIILQHVCSGSVVFAIKFQKNDNINENNVWIRINMCKNIYQYFKITYFINIKLLTA